MSATEYLGPVCRHVCLHCGGCDICCTDPGHRTAEEAEALIDPDCRDGKHGSCVGDPCECECHEGGAP